MVADAILLPARGQHIFIWNDEDRLVSQQFPDGHTGGYGYTGLGMRLSKADPTGSYSYLADGVSPCLR